MPVNSWDNYSTLICSFETGKCGKEGKMLQNLSILRTKGAFTMK